MSQRKWIYLPNLTYRQVLWAVTKRMSSDIQRELGVKLLFLCVKGSQLRCFGRLMLPEWLIIGGLPNMRGRLGIDLRLTRGIIYPAWPGNALGSRGRRWKVLLQRGMNSCCRGGWTVLNCSQIGSKDGWMYGCMSFQSLMKVTWMHHGSGAEFALGTYSDQQATVR